MVIKDCHCTLLNGNARPGCHDCNGTGQAPLTDKQIAQIREAAHHTLATHDRPPNRTLH